MKTILKRFTAGASLVVLASAFSGCSPMIVAHPRPRPVVHTTEIITPVPVQTVVTTPIIPVWAPPVSYVTEVHYYYFPDYMMYYDLVHQHYCYNSGTSWIYVSVLPSLPVFYGFDPHHSFLVVLNHSTYQPWIRHDYYVQQYPVGYYNTVFAPRTALGSNTKLRAYDENQSRPVFVDKRSNREVSVKYDVRPLRSDVDRNSIKSNSNAPLSTGRSNSRNQDPIKNQTESSNRNNSTPVSRNVKASQPQQDMGSLTHETKKNKSNETKSNRLADQRNIPGKEIKNDQFVNRQGDSRKAVKESETKKFQARVENRNKESKPESGKNNKQEQTNKRSK